MYWWEFLQNNLIVHDKFHVLAMPVTIPTSIFASATVKQVSYATNTRTEMLWPSHCLMHCLMHCNNKLFGLITSLSQNMPDTSLLAKPQSGGKSVDNWHVFMGECQHKYPRHTLTRPARILRNHPANPSSKPQIYCDMCWFSIAFNE